MADGVFQGDPFSGYGRFEYTSGVSTEGYLSDFTNGRYRVSGGFLYDTQVGSLPLSIGRQGDFTWKTLEANRYSLISQVRRNQINAGFSMQEITDTQGNTKTVPSDFMRMVSGSVDVLSADGTVHTFEVPQIPVAGIGAQWIASGLGVQPGDFQTFRGPFSSTAEVQALLGPNFRLATPEEAAERAIFKSIINNNIDAIRRFAEDNGITKGTYNTVESATVAYIIASANFENVQAYTATIVEG